MKQESKKSFSFVLFLFSFFILSSFIFYLSSCKRSTEPVYNSQNLQLKVLDVSCTEAWLSLQAKSDYLNKTLKLFKDDKLILEKPLATEDSLLYVDGLWPNTGYAFKAAVYEGAELLTKSVTVTATTMDTTSHDFTWQTFEFGGEGGSSSFYDVAIIDENDIWAVGEIYTANDKYNAAHWDGEKWELKKVPSIICGNNSPIQSAIFTVYSFSSNDVWFSDGAELIHYNGYNFKQDCSINTLLTGRINKIWGTSSSDLYVVGNSGLIAHYDGQKWQRIESGIPINIRDIWGAKTENNKFQIIALASNGGQIPQGKKLLLIQNNTVKYLNDSELDMSLAAIWFKPERKYYIGGAGLFESYGINASWQEDKSQPLLYISGIRGQSLNDIVLCGGYGHLSHFNGLNWKHYYGKELPQISGNLNEISIKRDLIVAVGWLMNRKAIIYMGIR
ncbi:glucosyl transferase [Calditrichota bacterium LG25]